MKIPIDKRHMDKDALHFWELAEKVVSHAIEIYFDDAETISTNMICSYFQGEKEKLIYFNDYGATIPRLVRANSEEIIYNTLMQNSLFKDFCINHGLCADESARRLAKQCNGYL